ncbi:CRISPR-associated protein Csx11 [Anoxybacter fermentans]|uniref:CRISPR-associated protein Csx11 n=2 Tax=Anoxybacter fermentans TaxID=1323375 RepID=A0A3Q9HUP0_9FIRM|nr:CRISPR-associated protein Csx11 [Anoxybacter fermentans]
MLKKIKEEQPQILTGEIGALLHDIGKCHPDFIWKNSREGGKDFQHGKIDKFLKFELVDLLRHRKFSFGSKEKLSDIYSVITEHHNDSYSNDLINLVRNCDQLDSADDKGVVRKEQSINSIIISTPFGYPKEIVDLNGLKSRLSELEERLIGILKDYIASRISLREFRKLIMDNLKVTFSHALGETRIPANDVTLWDHSYSTASLFKSVLCYIVLSEDSDLKGLKWRIFGVCWDGLGFIEKGRKIADILTRRQIIKDIKEKLKEMFEVEYPVGNAVYEDINGIYFTFPALEESKAVRLARECASVGLKEIFQISDQEIWPFFTLSRASRSLTILGRELKFASEKRNIPKMSPTLFVKGEESRESKQELIDYSLEILLKQEEICKENENCKKYCDICPICKIRSKDHKKEMCIKCNERRKGRLNSWLENRIDRTIWTDEVADINNRVALLTLSFNLDKWLDGKLVETIYSQTFEDWRNGKKYQKKKIINILNSYNIEQPGDSYINALKIAEWISKNPFRTEVKPLLECFLEDGSLNNIHTIDVIHNPQTILTYFFTQNPSPARLSRIWQETGEFWAEVLKRLTSGTRWKRLRFEIDFSQLKLKKDIEKNTPYILKFNDLEPDTLLVLHTEKGKFFTIESLEKFSTGEVKGLAAVQKMLKEEGFCWLAREDNPAENLLVENKASKQSVEENNFVAEDYYPFIEIVRTPLLFQIIVPALDAVKILEMITTMFNERFGKVIGKLPLNAGLLVANRKFPLYLLLEAGKRVLRSKEFQEPVLLDPWWDISNVKKDKFYSFYPLKKLNGDEHYTLDDIVPLSKGKAYALYPGYFDFELLGGNEDRYKLAYKDKRRVQEDYKLFSRRPYYLYQFKQMVDLWEILRNNLSTTQINFIERAITEKIKEWKGVEDFCKKDVFRGYVTATLQDAFGDRWFKLREETRCFILNSAMNNLLLDTIMLFRHVIKDREVDV